MNKYKNNLMSIGIYVIFTILMMVVIANKENLYIDETYSYGLANNHGSIEIVVEDGVRYEPADKPYIEYLCVEEGETFDYINVWRNQAADVHPPLYYVVLHTICSMFGGKFSIWYAGSINILFSLMALYMIRKIILLTSKDVKLMNLISLAFVCTSGILHSVSFLRMYSMAMFWVAWITYIFLLFSEKEKILPKDCMILIIASILGALIHYYCIIYLFFISLVFGCYLIYDKKWKDVLSFLISMSIAGIVTVLVFPAILQHVFLGYRGRQSIANLREASMLGYWNSIKKYVMYVNDHLLGGCGIAIVAAVFVVIIVAILNRKQEEIKRLRANDKIFLEISKKCKLFVENQKRYILLGIPSLFYLILIAKIAVYKTDRYIFPIYAIIYVFMTLMLYEIIKTAKVSKRINYIVYGICLTLMVLGSERKTEYAYLYQGTEKIVEEVQAYSDLECLYVYDELLRIQTSFYEVSEYKGVTFLQEENIEKLEKLNLQNLKEMMLIVPIGKQEKVVELLLEICPYLDECDEMWTFDSTTTYHLY